MPSILAIPWLNHRKRPHIREIQRQLGELRGGCAKKSKEKSRKESTTRDGYILYIYLRMLVSRL